MSKRVINSIIKNIERMVAQILKYENDAAGKQAEIQIKCDAKVNPLKDKIEKFEAMLELLNPTTPSDKENAA